MMQYTLMTMAMCMLVAAMAGCAPAPPATMRVRFDPRQGKPVLHIDPQPDGSTGPGVEITIRTIGNDESKDTVILTRTCDGAPETIKLPKVKNARAVGITARPVLEDKVATPKEYRTLPTGAKIEKYTGDPDWDRPGDFDAFWKRAKADLAKVPMNARVVEVPEKATATGRLFRVALDSTEGVTFICWLYVPKDTSRKYPAIQTMPGYGAAQNPNDLTAQGFVTLAVNPRGHGVSSEFWPLPNDHYAYHIDNPDKYYYRNAYLDCLRALEFLRTRPEVDKKRIAVEGSSQGGAFALATASLDGNVAACGAYVPFLSDFPTAVRLSTGGALSVLRKSFESNTPEGKAMRKTLSYIDARFMAERIKCPTMICVNLNDRICPPATAFANYNRLRKGLKKRMFVSPTLDHELTPEMTAEMGRWFRERLKPTP